MKKRSQITLFVIIGLLILLVAGFVVYVRYNATKGLLQNDLFQGRTEVTIKNYVQGCIDLTASNAMTFLGQRGFYLLSEPADVYNVNFDPKYPVTVLYDYNKDKNYLLTKSQVENEISAFFRNPDVGIQSCVKKAYLDKIVDSASLGTLTVSTTIRENDVVIDVSYPITFQKNNAATTVDTYQKDIPLPLGKIYDNVKTLLAKLKTYNENDNRRLYAENLIGTYYYGERKDYIACSAEFVPEMIADLKKWNVVSLSFQPNTVARDKSTTVEWIIQDAIGDKKFELFFVTRHKNNI